MLREALPKIVTPLPGPKAKAILDRRAAAVPNGIGTAYKAVIEKGEGAMFQDVDGNIFLDWIGGVGVLNIGYPSVSKQLRNRQTSSSTPCSISQHMKTMSSWQKR